MANKKLSDKQVNIFRYLDYRRFLADVYQDKKDKEGFTLRQFSHKAGFSSHAFLKQIIMGLRDVSVKSSWKICKGLDLNEREAEFFELLVRFKQAEDIEEKNDYYKRIIKLRPKDELARFDEQHLFILSNWYNLAIREMVALPSFKEDYQWIAKTLVPKITARQAKESIECLLELNYLKRDHGGRLIQSAPDITTGPEVRSLHASNYHHSIIVLADNAISRLPSEKRDISSLLLPLDKNEFNYIKKRIVEFRQEIIQYLKDHKEEIYEGESIEKDRVLFNLGMQLFQISENNWKMQGDNVCSQGQN